MLAMGRTEQDKSVVLPRSTLCIALSSLNFGIRSFHNLKVCDSVKCPEALMSLSAIVVYQMRSRTRPHSALEEPESTQR